MNPCKRCHDLYQSGLLRREMVMPVEEGARASLARDGSGPCCRDCAAADALQSGPMIGMDFPSSRIATGNCRQESLRLPGAPIGLIQAGYMRASEVGDFDKHHDWLDANVPWREGDGE